MYIFLYFVSLLQSEIIQNPDNVFVYKCRRQDKDPCAKCHFPIKFRQLRCPEGMESPKQKQTNIYFQVIIERIHIFSSIVEDTKVC
jgi:hypothetical protein